MKYAVSVALLGIAMLSPALTACQRHTKAEQYILDEAQDLVQREELSRQPTSIEAASLYKDKRSICGYATIGERKHVPYIIRYPYPFPEANFATVDTVYTRPKYKGAPYESQPDQSARILRECRQIGHVLPSY